MATRNSRVENIETSLDKIIWKNLVKQDLLFILSENAEVKELEVFEFAFSLGKYKNGDVSIKVKVFQMRMIKTFSKEELWRNLGISAKQVSLKYDLSYSDLLRNAKEFEIPVQG